MATEATTGRVIFITVLVIIGFFLLGFIFRQIWKEMQLRKGIVSNGNGNGNGTLQVCPTAVQSIDGKVPLCKANGKFYKTICSGQPAPSPLRTAFAEPVPCIWEEITETEYNTIMAQNASA